MRVVNLKLGLMTLMAGTLISAGIFTALPVKAMELQADAVTTEYLNQPLSVKGGEQKVILNLRNINLRDLLKLLANKSGFNILLDQTVQGTISVDLNNISVNEALSSIKDYANLVYMQDDKTLVVAAKDSPLAKAITQQVSQMIPVKYVNAKFVAQLLNATVFAPDSGGSASGSGTAGASAAGKASAEYRTNSVVVVGTDNDIRLAQDLIRNIDIPRKSKTFQINHANVVDVVQLLKATVYNDGVTPFGGQAASAQGNALPNSPTPVSILTETFEEGSGSATEVQGSAGSAGGGGGQQQTFTLRSKSIAVKDISISPEGPIVVPDTRANTITIMGTDEQIALAEAVIPTLDQKLPQVAIETSLLELDISAIKNMEVIWGEAGGRFASGFNNVATPPGQTIVTDFGYPAIQPLGDYTSTTGVQADNYFGRLTDIIGLPTTRGAGDINGVGSSLAVTSVPINRVKDFIYQINAVLSKGKGKLLANPTIIAMRNTEAVISITEEVVRRTTVTQDAIGGSQVQIEIGEAGIVLNILPKVNGDDTISLRIRPSITTVAEVVADADGNQTTLLDRRDFAVQEVRLANSQTLALGGLISERSRKDYSTVPGIGDLPLVGALFRSQFREDRRNELLMLVTPRILQDNQPVPVGSTLNNPSVKPLSDSGSQIPVSPQE